MTEVGASLLGQSQVSRMEAPGTEAACQPSTLRIYIISETCLWREGLEKVLDQEPGMDVVGTGADWASSEGPIRDLAPDMVLLDMGTPESLGMVRVVPETRPGAKVVALAVPDESQVIDCAEAGISGYVTRDDSVEVLLETMRSAARGELRCSPSIAAALLRRVGRLTAERPRRRGRLTARQREIAKLIREGLSNKEIAARLCIELPTVKNHVHAILEKLEIGSRHEIGRRVIQL